MGVEEKILHYASEKIKLDGTIIQAGLFNQKATDMDRRDKLKELLTK